MIRAIQIVTNSADVASLINIVLWASLEAVLWGLLRVVSTWSGLWAS
jgi:hypothetical protein